MRRVLPFVALALVCAGLAIAAAASGDGSREDGAHAPARFEAVSAGATTAGRPQRDGHGHGAIARMVLASLADRLGTEPQALKAAARDAIRELHRSGTTDLAAKKARLAAAIGAALGKDRGAVLDAVRAELVQRLAQARRTGLVSAKGSRLALGCFDRPASCDLAALRGEVRLLHGHASDRGG